MKYASKVLALFAVASGLATAASAAVETYVIDPVHSSVGFKIRHIIGKVPGSFTKFGGTIVVDRDNLENSTVEATIEVGSISTFNDYRDKDLEVPKLLRRREVRDDDFQEQGVEEATGDSTFDVTGDLT